MKVKLKKASQKSTVYDITELITGFTWQGSASQASRSLEFNMAQSPFDKDFSCVKPELGDVVYLYDDDKKLLFLGRVLRRTASSAPGEEQYSAYDFMNLLLKSKVNYNFKKSTPENITQKILSDLGVPIGSLEKTSISIKTLLAESESAYNVIIGAYYRAYKKTQKSYMPKMDGEKFTMVKRGERSGVTLRLSENVIKTSLEEDATDVVNRVLIVDENSKRISSVKNAESIKLFGIYQDIYQKTKDEDSKKEAQAMLKGVNTTASLEAVGDTRCTAGASVFLYDDITGLTGEFWIESDTHSFKNNVHTMTLELAFKNMMEGSGESGKKAATSDSVCYYSTTSEKYHSQRICGSGLIQPIKSTVAEAQKTGRKKCSRCWL